jgi:hypothetical protein
MLGEDQQGGVHVLNWILVFIATLLVDVAWTRYIAEAAAKKALPAASWSAAIVAFGAFNVVAYQTDRMLIIPAILGAFVGTYVAVWKEKPKT